MTTTVQEAATIFSRLVAEGFGSRPLVMKKGGEYFDLNDIIDTVNVHKYIDDAEGHLFAEEPTTHVVLLEMGREPRFGPEPGQL